MTVSHGGFRSPVVCFFTLFFSGIPFFYRYKERSPKVPVAGEKGSWEGLNLWKTLYLQSAYG